MTKSLVSDFGEKHKHELLTTGLTHCELSCKNAAEEVAAGLMRLVDLPKKERDRWTPALPHSLKISRAEREKWRKITAHQGQADLGLFRRGGFNKETGEKEDPKWAFHYKPELRELFHLKGVDTGDGRDFLDAAEELHALATELCITACLKLGVELRNPFSALRCVLYDAVKKPGHTVALPHWDRNGLTVHCAESHPGLKVPVNDIFAPENPEMRILPRAADNLVHLFVSAKLGAADPGRFRPVWHEGMSPEVGVRRWALVVFFHPWKDNLPDWFRSKSRDPLARMVREAQTHAAK